MQVTEKYFYYPGSPWYARPGKLSGMGINSPGFLLEYSLVALVGRKGFLLYNPLLLLALPCLVMEIVRRGRFWREAST